MKTKKSFWVGALCGALTMCIISMIVNGTLPFGNAEGIVGKETSRKLELVRSLIDSEYLYTDEIDEEAMQDGIVKGYVESLGEPYTVYYNQEETQKLKESTSGEFGGIGVGITQDSTTGVMTFGKIYEDSPGEKGGFRTGDIVYKVNGENVSELDLDTVVAKIRGEIGTEVEITVFRGDTREEYTATVVRELIETETVVCEMKEDGIGYIYVNSFDTVTYNQFEEAMNTLEDQGMERLIIDLRSNPGGNLSTVCEMLDLILPKGTMVSIQDRNGNGKEYTSDDEKQMDVPMVVLINGYSASASEIFAGAMQDYEKATLVGTQTYGKGIVQDIQMFSDGTSLKYTSSEYFTPKGRNIHGIGITPDVEVEYVYDEKHPEADNQLEKAIEILKNGK